MRSESGQRDDSKPAGAGNHHHGVRAPAAGGTGHRPPGEHFSGGHPDQRNDAVVHTQAAGHVCHDDRGGSLDAERDDGIHAAAVCEHSLDGGMISITTAELNALLAAFLWPLTRVLALVASAPVLGNPSVPLRVRLGLAVLITLIVAPTLGPMPQVEPGSQAGLLILAHQIVIGLAIGFAMRAVFVAVEMAGGTVAVCIGVGVV